MNFSANNLKVLVAYDDFVSGCRAMALLKRLEGPGRRELNHIMLRFDLIADVTFFELAVSEALVADVVVIATGEGNQLPRMVRQWVVQWMLRKADSPQALVATFEYNPAKAIGQGRIAADLEALADQGRVHFFCNGASQARKLDFGKNPAEDWALDSALVRPQTAGQN